MHGEKNVSVIFAGIVFRFDVEESELSGIQATTQIFTGKGVSVIPAGSARLRSERDGVILPLAPSAYLPPWPRPLPKARRGGANGPGSNVAVIFYLHDDSLPFLHPQQRSRRAAVVTKQFGYLPGVQVRD